MRVIHFQAGGSGQLYIWFQANCHYYMVCGKLKQINNGQIMYCTVGEFTISSLSLKTIRTMYARVRIHGILKEFKIEAGMHDIPVAFHYAYEWSGEGNESTHYFIKPRSPSLVIIH